MRAPNRMNYGWRKTVPQIKAPVLILLGVGAALAAGDGSAVADALREHGAERFAAAGKRSPAPEDTTN